jgi:bifunctional enzyme CysN/CysC
MVDAGLIVLASFISPFRAERQLARDLCADAKFVEVYVDAPLEVAEGRDRKGLYAKARRGDLVHLTGVDSPYEPPEQAEVHLDTTSLTAETAADLVVAHLRAAGILTPPQP